MKKINQLDPSVYNLISAGEVVENPASVIKELVDNSIDAGASEITISIEEGGIKKIQIIDNGEGIDKEDIHLTYQPHATSKLKSAADLSSISTLGFRGEALASIASVSHLTVASNPKNGEGIGYFVRVSGGVVEEEGEIGMNIGTSITVDELFYNTPVRLKFLKTPKQEESLVKNKVTSLIFSNPDVKFKLIIDGEVELQTAGGLEDAIYEVYGTEVSNNLIPFDHSFGNYRAYGYTSNPEFIKHNKQYQTVIVNGRPITNQNIALAVMQAYGNLLMKRTYPVYVLNIVMPFDEVDVNVHPTKSDVRFQDAHKVFSIVYRAILQALDTQAKTLDLSAISKEEQNNEQEKQTNVQHKNEQMFGDIYNASLHYETVPNSYQNSDINKNSNLQNVMDSLLNKNSDLENSQKSAIENYSISKSILQKANNSYSNLENDNNFDEETILNNIKNKDVPMTYTVLGQLFETFLVIQDGPYAYLIDQHACHEKFLYEKWIDLLNRREIVSQPLFIPYVFTCNSNQYDFMKNLNGSLSELGFEIEEFGDLTFKINAVPAFLSEMNLDKFFEEILVEKNVLVNLKASDLIKDKLAQWACKAAVKAGDSLSDAQVRELFRQMKNNVPMQCPHGRPCIFTFTRTDLDKLFKRIE